MNIGKIEHRGDPEKLYRQPRTSFVATFMGDANILEGKLVSENGKHTVLLGDFRIDSNSIPPNLDSNNVKVAVRPEAIRLDENRSDNCLECEISWCAYVGSAFEYTLKSAIGDIFAVIPSSEKHFITGDKAFISVSDVGVAVLEY